MTMKAWYMKEVVLEGNLHCYILVFTLVNKRSDTRNKIATSSTIISIKMFAKYSLNCYAYSLKFLTYFPQSPFFVTG